MLARAVDHALEKALADTVFSRRDPYIIETFHQDHLHQFVQDRCLQWCYQNDHKVYIRSDTLKEGVRISLTVLNAEISYKDASEDHDSRENTIRRIAHISFTMKMTDAMTGQLLWLGNLNHVDADWIPLELLDIVERNSTFLEKPVRPQKKSLIHWLEPVLIAGAIGTISILFYTIRSQ